MFGRMVVLFLLDPLATDQAIRTKVPSSFGRWSMQVKYDAILLPLVYLNAVLIFIPMMYCQVLIVNEGTSAGMSKLQIAILFCNAPVLMSLLGGYWIHSDRAVGLKIGSLLCSCSISLSAVTAVLSFLPITNGISIWFLWLILLSLLSTCCFFAQLACFAVISRYSHPSGVLISDILHAASALIGLMLSHLFSSFFEKGGTLLVVACLTALPSLILMVIRIDDSPLPSLEVQKELESSNAGPIKLCYSDERLNNDLLQESPSLKLETDAFAKNLIDTDAQAIILMNIIYMVTVCVSQGVQCMYLMHTTQQSRLQTLNKCCFLYASGVVSSSAGCCISRYFLQGHSSCKKILTILYIAVSNIACLFLISDINVYIGKSLLSYYILVTNSQILEEVIEAVVTRYYDNINLPAMKSFSVKDYINSKMAILHSIASAAVPLLFGLLAADWEVETLFFTVAAIFTTLTVITTPLALLFIAADLR